MQPTARKLAPVTPSWRVFSRWCAKRGRVALLASATGIGQQSLSNYKLRIVRPPADRARLIAEAVKRLTGDNCPADGWETRAERRARLARLRAVEAIVADDKAVA